MLYTVEYEEPVTREIRTVVVEAGPPEDALQLWRAECAYALHHMAPPVFLSLSWISDAPVIRAHEEV
jgi:hypothetical protein